MVDMVAYKLFLSKSARENSLCTRSDEFGRSHMEIIHSILQTDLFIDSYLICRFTSTFPLGSKSVFSKILQSFVESCTVLVWLLPALGTPPFLYDYDFIFTVLCPL